MKVNLVFQNTIAILNTITINCLNKNGNNLKAGTAFSILETRAVISYTKNDFIVSFDTINIKYYYIKPLKIQ